MDLSLPWYHQLDFVTPGISPRRLRNLKQMRQSLNFRRNPLTRPQLGQRLYARVVNLGVILTFNRRANRDTVLRPPIQIRFGRGRLNVSRAPSLRRWSWRWSQS